MYNVRDKVYYYSETQDRYFPAVVLAINLDKKLYVIKYWDENNNWHLVNDVSEEDINYRHHTETVEKDSDMVNNPKHYTHGKIEVIEAIEDWDMNFCLGNAIKYIARCNHKGNKKQDLEKAIWYIKRELGE